MKKVLYSIFIVLSIFALNSCAREEFPKEVLATINDYSLYTEDFLSEAKLYPPSHRESLTKEQILDNLIQKKLLLLEAQRQGLDKDPAFMKMVERFWEQSLLRSLLEKKSDKFRQIDPRLCSIQRAMEIIAQTLGVSLEGLWQDFSLYVYKISSLQTEGEKSLRSVYMSKLSSRKNKTHSGICSFGFDFYDIDLKQNFESVQINGRKNLNYLVGISSTENFRVLPLEENN